MPTVEPARSYWQLSTDYRIGSTNCARYVPSLSPISMGHEEVQQRTGQRAMSEVLICDWLHCYDPPVVVQDQL